MIEIEHDVFDIAWRMKSIDERYRLYYNRKSRRYEVYIGDTLESVIPYDTLDIRTLEYLRKTRRENIDALMAEIEEHNRRLEEESNRRIMERANSRIEEVLE